MQQSAAEIENKKRPVLVLTGPTAVGKTKLSLELAKAVQGSIISADSMQVYRHMNIGSAKIRPEEMQGIPHYLIDVLEPSEEFNVATFQAMAREAMEEIWAAGRIPILTGGTGFYIQAVLRDVDFSESDGKSAIRLRLEQEAEALGEMADEILHSRLAEVDPEAAAEIHANNRKRVIRALEFFEQTGTPISLHNAQQREKSSPYNSCYFVLTEDRARLYEKIGIRVDQMIEDGLVEEVRQLMGIGLTEANTSMKGLGYKELFPYLRGECSLEEAVTIIKRDTRHFAKRQLTWFRRESDVIWLMRKGRPDDDARILEQMLACCRQKGIIK